MKIRIGFNFVTLFLVFLVLKLTGVIGWSWWWVAAPLWLPWAIVIAFFGLIFVCLVCAELMKRV